MCACVCVWSQGSLKLIDFGIAKALSSDTTNIVRDSQVGTVNYMSPESITADSSRDGALKVRTRGASGCARRLRERARDSGGGQRE